MFLLVRVLIVGAATSLVPLPTSAQDSRPTDSVNRATLAADDILRQVDERLYMARYCGLRDIRFRWRLEGEMMFAAGSHDMVFSWDRRRPGDYDIKLRDLAGKPISEPPEVFRATPQAKQAWEHARQSLIALAFSRVIGAPNAAIYRDYVKRVRTREVNNKVETRIVMTPKRKKLNRQVVMVIRGGVPVQVEKSRPDGLVNRLTFRYTERDGKHLLQGMVSEVNNQVFMEENYHYVQKKGILICHRIERFLRAGPKRKTVIRLEDLAVNLTPVKMPESAPQRKSAQPKTDDKTKKPSKSRGSK